MMYLYAKLNKDFSVYFEVTNHLELKYIHDQIVLETLKSKLQEGNTEWNKFIISQMELVKKVPERVRL